MNDDSAARPDDEFRELFEKFLSGNGDIDPAALAGAAGLPRDPAALQALFAQLRNALSQPTSPEATAQLALDQAISAAGQNDRSIDAESSTAFGHAFDVADIWLTDATEFGALQARPVLLTRREWVRLTMPVWNALSTPVSSRISDAMTSLLESQTPEDLVGELGGASGVLRSLGGTLFAMQLGHVVGQLASEVVSGGDIGVALLPDGKAALLPHNVSALATGLDIDEQEVRLYLAVRELAHARLFHHARWLPLDLQSALTAYAQGIRIDASPLEHLMDDFDPSNPEELRAALTDGRLIPPKTEDQERALARIETQLALIEGWVDVVTHEATRRLPKADALSETMRRRRAGGGPAESAFAALVGLELRPRRLREASMMWRRITDAVGVNARDALWAHPDLMPTGDDIDDPAALIDRVVATARGDAPMQDDMDRALDDLLRGDAPPED